MNTTGIAIISTKSIPLFPFFDARQKRLWVATEAHALGRGGITTVHHATGLCRASIRKGIKELQENLPVHAVVFKIGKLVKHEKGENGIIP